MKFGVQEAYLSAANNYIAMEQKKNATTTLKNYKVKYPQEAEVADRLIEEIDKRGRWNVWQILNINVPATPSAPVATAAPGTATPAQPAS